MRVYEANQGRLTDTPGLCLLHKVKAGHIFLTSFSRMRVDLAAQVREMNTFVWVCVCVIFLYLQVLSSSVGNAMENMGDTSVSNDPIRQDF